MPSMSAHMAIACKLSNKLNVDKKEFIKGNILPDLYENKEKSHYKIQGKRYTVPNIEEAVKTLDLSKSIDIGYLSHLLLDYYYFNEYLIKYDNDLFKNSDIYKDYDILNIDIINYYKIDINYIKSILTDFPKGINKRRLTNNINCLDLIIKDNTKILNKKDFLNFLDKISVKIENDIKELISNERM